MKRLRLLVFITCCSITHAYGQDFEGTILFEISYLNLSKEMKDMLPKENPKTLFSIKGTKTKMEMDMMGTKMIIISDLETNTSTSYTDVMGQKVKSVIPLEDQTTGKVELFEGETKKIAGYSCKRAVFTQSGSPDVEVFYTEDLQSSAFSSMQSQFAKLKGLPLEYQVHQQGMTMIYSAKEVTKQQMAENAFNPPSGDYKVAPPMPKY